MEHELAVLECLCGEHGPAWSPQDAGDPFAVTYEAMRAGRPLIHQGVLRAASFEGRPDFLIRCERPSALGSWSYTPVDAKLSRQLEPRFLIQLATYAELRNQPPALKAPKTHRLLSRVRPLRRGRGATWATTNADRTRGRLGERRCWSLQPR
jgi:predicted RecB family nuclease